MKTLEDKVKEYEFETALEILDKIKFKCYKIFHMGV
jgi:hypothetical protein